jgi:hypothetical protein
MDDSKDLEALLSQLKFDFDDNLLYANSPAATITTAASNTWPYSSTGGYNLGTTISPSLSFSDNWKQSDAKLKVQGDAEFEGDIKLKGKSLNETLDKIEQRLGILYPNEKLEEKWEELKKLGDAYRALEQDILEKEKIWNTLKK